MMKSSENINLSTFTKTFSMIPQGWVRNLSASCKVTVVGRASPKFNFLKIDSGIRLMLAPKSQRAFSKTEFPMAQGMVKLSGSLSLGGNFFYSMELHFQKR